MRILVGYIAIIVLLFGRALIPTNTQLIFGDDIHRVYYFYRQFFNESLKQGIFPWWNPYLFSGTPYAANAITTLWYPPTWLFVFLPLPIAYSIHIALHLCWAMVGMYWLCRRHLAFPRIGSWLAGVVFGFSGFFVARIWAGHVDIIAAASWMPWVFAAFWGLTKKVYPKAVVVAAILFALQLYAGYQTMAFFTIEAVGIALVIHTVVHKSIRAIFAALVTGIVGLGLAALQLIPAQELFRLSIRTFPLPYSWSQYGSLTFQSLWQLASPFIFGDQRTYHGPPPNYAEHAMFVGRATLLLIGSLLVRKRMKIGITAAVFAAIAVYGLWVSLSRNAPVDLQKILWEIFPMYHYLRFPPRHLVLFVFGMAVLVGFALSTVRSQIVRWIITILVVFELIMYGRHFIATEPIPETRHDRSLVEILTTQDNLTRILPNFGVWVEPRDSLDFDSAVSYRFFSATGYDPTIIRNYYEFIDAASGNQTPSILSHDVQVPYMDLSSPYINFLNIGYLLLNPLYDPIGTSNDRFELVRQDKARGYRLYENLAASPRFFLVPTVTVLPSREAIAQEISKKQVDLTREILVTRPMDTAQNPCSDASPGSVEVRHYSPNEITLSTSSSCDSYLSTSEVYYPGWEATVDGRPSTVVEGNLAFRTLSVPKGEHTIIFRYNPRIFYMGAFVSIAFVIGCVIAIRHEKKYSS